MLDFPRVFELDSIHGEIRLLQQNLTDIRSEVHQWLDRKSSMKRELESLVGRLSHTSHVVKPGKTFMRHLFEALDRNLTDSPSCPRLSASTRSDIQWWYTFMAECTGVRIIPHLWTLSTEIWSHVSGSFGCGAVCLTLSRWTQLQWTRGNKSWGGGQYN